MGIRDMYRNGGTPISSAIDRFFQAKDAAATKRLMPEAMSGSPEALNQLMAVNPAAGQQVMYTMQQKQQQQMMADKFKADQAQQIIDNQIKDKQLAMEDIKLKMAQDELEASKNAAPKPIALSEGQKLIDPTTFKTLAENPKDVDPKEALDQASNLRKEFTGQSVLFKTQDDAYGRIVASAQKPSAAGDLALITSYMKVLDPTSSVREGEFATAQNSGSVDQKVVALYNQMLSGKRLTPEQREDFVGKAKDLYKDAADKQLKVNDRYGKLATRYGVAPEDVVENYVNYREDALKAISKPAQQAGGAKFLGFEP